MNSVSVIIPAFNEADRIAVTVRSVLAIPGVSEVIVVDDGSTDDTASFAEKAGATRVIRQARNEGKGAAMNAGWKAASGDILLFLDADLGETSREGEKLLPPLWNSQADLVVAGFNRSGKRAGFGLVVRLSRWGIRAMTGQEVEFPLSGQRAMRQEVVERIGGFSGGYSVETAMSIDALRAGYRLLEVPTEMTHKATGRNWAGFRHRGRQWIHVSSALFQKWLRR